LYLSEAGPYMDRFARVVPGRNFGYDGTNASMRTHAIYNWMPAQCVLNVAFVQRENASDTQFAAQKMDHAFVTLTGSTWASGRLFHGKRIVEFVPNRAGRYKARPKTFVEYMGVGKATPAGIAAAPDGLYFTDLYKDRELESPTERGAKLWRVRETKKPRLSRVRFRARTLRARYVASEPAAVSATIRRAEDGRRVGRLNDLAETGPNRFRLNAARARLGAGRYVLILRARDVAGNRSRPARARFRISP
jgi:hypothetical protein